MNVMLTRNEKTSHLKMRKPIAHRKKKKRIMAYESSNPGQFIFKYVSRIRKNAQDIKKK